jgi:hypothetical protein
MCHYVKNLNIYTIFSVFKLFLRLFPRLCVLTEPERISLIRSRNLRVVLLKSDLIFLLLNDLIIFSKLFIFCLTYKKSKH